MSKYIFALFICLIVLSLVASFAPISQQSRYARTSTVVMDGMLEYIILLCASLCMKTAYCQCIKTLRYNVRHSPQDAIIFIQSIPIASESLHKRYHCLESAREQ